MLERAIRRYRFVPGHCPHKWSEYAGRGLMRLGDGPDETWTIVAIDGGPVVCVRTDSIEFVDEIVTGHTAEQAAAEQDRDDSDLQGQALVRRCEELGKSSRGNGWSRLLYRAAQEIRELQHMCVELQVGARRYANGRATYYPSVVNDITRRLVRMGVRPNPCAEGTIWAEGVYDKPDAEHFVPGHPIAVGALLGLEPGTSVAAEVLKELGLPAGSGVYAVVERIQSLKGTHYVGSGNADGPRLC